MPVTRSKTARSLSNHPLDGKLPEYPPQTISRTQSFGHFPGKQISTRSPLSGMVKSRFSTASSSSSSSIRNSEKFVSVERMHLREIESEELAIQIKKLELREKQLALKKEALVGVLEQKEDCFSDIEAAPHQLNPHAKVEQYLDQCEPTGQSPVPAVIQPQPIQCLRRLPELDVTKFDGSPKRLWRFMSCFKADIAIHLKDDRERLSYLINYCTGEARESIEDCVMLPNDAGYSRALSILETQFGCPDDVAENFLDDLVHGETVRSGDVVALRKLVRLAVSSEIALTEMGYESILNCSTTIKGIIRRLPESTQVRWADVALGHRRKNILICFRHLVEFLEECLTTANYCYGHSPEIKKQITERSAQAVNRYSGFRPRINAITTEYHPRCPVCRSDHKLEVCDKFSAMSHETKLHALRNFNRCFNCLNVGHPARKCPLQVRCNEASCGGRHHTLLHITPNVTINTTGTKSFPIHLGFIPIRLIGPSGIVKTYAFLDSGSDATLLVSSLAERVGITGPSTRLNVTTVGGTSVENTTTVNFTIESLKGNYQVPVERAYTVDRLPIRKTTTSYGVSERWPHLKGIQFDELDNDAVGLLIGANISEAHWVVDQRIGTSKQPYARLTVLGWVLLGPSVERELERTLVNCFVAQTSVESDILRMFEHDFDGTNCDEVSISAEDRHVLESTKQTICLVNGHYQLRLPWKMNWHGLPDNRVLAEKRLFHLQTRLRKDAELLRKYSEIIENHENKGYIRRLSTTHVGELRFVPHHPVLNPRKPGKVRIVFDFAAKFGGFSLNDCLYSGPDLTNDLTGVLLRFRRHHIALSADIEEMFLQVRLAPEDRDAMCFLWYPSGNLDSTPSVYQLNVHPFGATSSPFCASFALKKVAEDHSTLFDDCTTTTVQENFYVDDCLTSVHSVEAAKALVEQLRRMLMLGGFRLHKWVSNNEEVLRSIPLSERACDLVNLSPSDSLVHKTLGLYWCVKTDCFKFQVDLPNRPITRRGILSCSASLYDPLGYVAPLLLQPKRLLQKLCHSNCGWDEVAEDSIQTAWKQWQSDVQSVEKLSIQRCLKPEDFHVGTSSLHLFSDASELGYGSVVYLRLQSLDHRVHCSFLMGKSRVAPLKPVTIPRLELQAAVLSVKLLQHIKSELKITLDAVHLWTDSTIVLHYIHNTRSRFKTFVANRVEFIRGNSTIEHWRYVPTSDNPADLASRGISGGDIIQLKRWIKGPNFLYDAESSWPQTTIPSFNSDDLELKAEKLIMTVVTDESPIAKFLSYYSSWSKLKRSTAWLLRLKANLRMRIVDRAKKWPLTGMLKVEELENAESAVIRFVQEQEFNETLISLTRSAIPLKRSPLRELRPVLKDGVLCVGGRLANSDLLDTCKHPIILPSRHPVTTCIVHHYHETEGHMGMTHVLAMTRKRYWIVRGASSVKRILSRCIGCKMRSAKPLDQVMSNLPSVRTQPGFPFAVTGIDYFGPFHVRDGRKNHKRYGCIFSCLKTRAVHLEVAHFLTIDSFLMAFNRFINRRGCPVQVFSDQGTNFVGAEVELRSFLKGMEHSNLGVQLLSKQIEWHFNPPYSSHRGGVWERLIRSVRRILSAVSREQVLTDESLSTYLTEVERILNNRPLVPVYDDPDCPSILTPNSILLLRESTEPCTDHVDLRERYTRRWRQGQVLADTFWQRWLKEYLPTLQRRSKWDTLHRDLRVGDLVLILGGPQPKGHWPKGVVCDIVHSGDGHIREAHIRTTSGVIRRDIRKICLLEGASGD